MNKTERVRIEKLNWRINRLLNLKKLKELDRKAEFLHEAWYMKTKFEFLSLLIQRLNNDRDFRYFSLDEGGN